MHLYRVFPHLPSAGPGEPGSATYLHRPQGSNRLDNPAIYDAWYFGLTPEAAVGEVFGDLAVWRDEMFELPILAGSRKVLGRYTVPDGVGVLDLDDAKALAHRNLRPTQVISRNRPVTQTWALDIYREDKWEGIRWWSFQRPHWTVVCLWSGIASTCPATFVEHDDLHLDHVAVVDAATSLHKHRVP